jgi:hypothetical protein
MSERALIEWRNPEDVKSGDRIIDVDEESPDGIWTASSDIGAIQHLRRDCGVKRVAVIVDDNPLDPEVIRAALAVTRAALAWDANFSTFECPEEGGFWHAVDALPADVREVLGR